VHVITAPNRSTNSYFLTPPRAAPIYCAPLGAYENWCGITFHGRCPWLTYPAPLRANMLNQNFKKCKHPNACGICKGAYGNWCGTGFHGRCPWLTYPAPLRANMLNQNFKKCKHPQCMRHMQKPKGFCKRRAPKGRTKKLGATPQDKIQSHR